MKLKRARPYLIALVALLAVWIGRAMIEGRSAVRRCDERIERGDIEGAIAEAMRATRMYVPFASHPRDGYDRLRTIALNAELHGDVDTALIAWQAVRAGARGTRTLFAPYGDRLEEADDHIALILASRAPPGIDRDKTRDILVREHRAILALDDAPKPWAIVALYLGLAAFFLGVIRAVSIVADAAGDKVAIDRWGGGRGARAFAFGAMTLVGLVTMLIALSRA